MKIPYDFKKCIICLDRPCGDWEHVLPDSIGGRLQGRMLCNPCNNNLGSTLVGKLKHNASIRLAMEALKAEIPSLYAKTQAKASFVGKATDGSKVRASLNKTKPKILSGKGANDSLILDTSEVANGLMTKLLRRGISPEEAKAWQIKFRQLEEDTPLQIPTGEIYVKRHTPSLQPELSTIRVDDRLYVLIAFEFLSFLIGEQIYAPFFHPVRNYIQGGDSPDIVTIQHLAAGRQYDSFHVISVSPTEGAVSIDIRLFKWITIVVTFNHIDPRAPDIVYLEDLKTPRSLFALTKEDARQGNWISL